MRAREFIKDQTNNLTEEDVHLVEMANLPPEDTGVKGVIYISSMQGSHGPRVKWFPQAPRSTNDPCLSVSIDPNPTARNLNLPKRIAEGAVDSVTAWVKLNQIKLLDYWNNGYSWTRTQVNTFIDGLEKLP